MENLLLNAEEHNFLIVHKKNLEEQNDVKIDVPNFINDTDSELSVNDIIFATISGNASGIEKIKDLMHQRLKAGVKSGCQENNPASFQRDIPLITLSDSDSETLSVLQEQQNQRKVVLKRRKRGRVLTDAVDLTVSPNVTNENIFENKGTKRGVLFDSVDLTVSPNVTSENICEVKSRKRERVLFDAVDLTVSPVVKNENNSEVSSTTNEPDSKKRKIENIQFTAILPISLEINRNYPLPQGKSDNYGMKRQELSHSHLPRKFELKENNRIKRSGRGTKGKRKQWRKNHKKFPAEDFISLGTENKNSCLEKNDTEIICLDQSTVERPLPKDPKLLRPIVIDGSNVAREHGKATNTFSCKGIQISVQFFLERGHTKVTAFVPNFRRYCLHGIVATTDENIMEELARSSHVVFTPSRKVNGKRVTCYDDRFIVELASKNGGVILSNDNYKDLLGESEAFKKTIEERLLMFCFVGDLLMVPDDPLGRDGPRLNEFLYFPESQ